MRPRCGFRPKSEQYAAGMRIEPAPSEAVAADARPAATAAPLPPDDPPGTRVTSHGFRVTPQVGDSVNIANASSGRFVLPITIAPAARSLLTTSESSRAGSSTAPVPIVVTSPATSCVSFTAIGTPSKGASSPASRRRSASSASASACSARTTRNAFSFESSWAIRSRYSVTSSRGDTSPARTSSACLAGPANATSVSAIGRGTVFGRPADPCRRPESGPAAGLEGGEEEDRGRRIVECRFGGDVVGAAVLIRREARIELPVEVEALAADLARRGRPPDHRARRQRLSEDGGPVVRMDRRIGAVADDEARAEWVAPEQVVASPGRNAAAGGESGGASGEPCQGAARPVLRGRAPGEEARHPERVVVGLLHSDGAELAQSLAGELALGGRAHGGSAEGSAEVGGREARERIDHPERAVGLALRRMQEAKRVGEVGGLPGRPVEGGCAGGHRVLPVGVAVEAAGEARRGPPRRLARGVPLLRLEEVGRVVRPVVRERQRGRGLSGDVPAD